jgi:hypothetical protein
MGLRYRLARLTPGCISGGLLDEVEPGPSDLVHGLQAIWRYEKTGLSQANEGVVSPESSARLVQGDDVRPSVNQALRLDGRAFRSMNRTTATASVSHRQQRSHRFRTLRQSHASRSLPAPSRNVHASGHRMTMSRKLDK